MNPDQNHMDFLVKFFPIFKLESDFFPNFLSKIRKLENCENLFSLNFIWANFEQDLRQFFFEKKGLCSSGILKKKSKNFPNFKLEIGFFSDFAKKVANIPKLRKFICPELHLSQFSAKLEELFWSVSHSLSLASLALCSGRGCRS